MVIFMHFTENSSGSRIRPSHVGGNISHAMGCPGPSNNCSQPLLPQLLHVSPGVMNMQDIARRKLNTIVEAFCIPTLEDPDLLKARFLCCCYYLKKEIMAHSGCSVHDNELKGIDSTYMDN